MSGLLGGGGRGQAQAPTRLAGLKVQTSTYGKPIAVVYGTNRIAGNLLWYGDFVATPRTTKTPSSGKGGGSVQASTTYSYAAATAIALCEGPIQSIGSITNNNGNVSTVTVAEEYTVPVGGGTVTVENASNFSVDFGVTTPVTVNQPKQDYGDPAGSGTVDVTMPKKMTRAVA